jgi:hypothetical protein
MQSGLDQTGSQQIMYTDFVQYYSVDNHQSLTLLYASREHYVLKTHI